MTHKAREVLNDCCVALNMLEEESDLQRWRILWAAAVALIRAVGHVLDKVDGEDQIVKAVAREFYKTWKCDAEHIIFREFIEHERNILLKEYRSDVHPLDKVQVVVEMPIVPVHGGEPQTSAQVFDLDENIYRPILDGPWQGVDAREVLGEAIEWWNLQLDAIDGAVALHKKK